MFDTEHLVDPALLEEDHELGFRLTVAAYGEIVPDGQHFLPDDLEEIVPGRYLAAILSSIDRTKLSGYDVVRLLQARDRLVSHTQAGFYADVGEVAHACDPDTPARDVYPVGWAAEEVQTALMRTRRSAEADLDLALRLRSRLPDVFDAMESGQVDLGRAKVFCWELESLHPALVPEAVDRVISEASGLTTGQLRARLQRIVTQLDPEGRSERFGAGIEDRVMAVQSNPDLTGSLLLFNADPKQILLASRYVHGLALKHKARPGETRSLDQIKVDIALDLLQGKKIEGAPPAPAQIMILIDQAAGRVPGYGTILPETIAALLEDATIDINTEDCAHETASRRPTRTQRRHVQRRYPTCVWPGCRQPAVVCDLDHRDPVAAGGPTTCRNLAPLCRHHHMCKPVWKLDRHPDGSHTWTSPLRHTYQTGRPP